MMVIVAAFALMQQVQHAKVPILSCLHAPGIIGRTTALIEPLTFLLTCAYSTRQVIIPSQLPQMKSWLHGYVIERCSLTTAFLNAL